MSFIISLMKLTPEFSENLIVSFEFYDKLYFKMQIER